MDASDAIIQRHSVRAYTDQQLEPETLRSVMELASHSPSWANTQPWEVYIATGDTLEAIRNGYTESFHSGVDRNPDLEMPGQWPEQHERRMAELRDARIKSIVEQTGSEPKRESLMKLNAHMFGAPAVAFICMDRSLSAWSVYDLGLFSQTLMLSATAHGVASIPAFNLVAFPAILRQELQIPENLSIIMGIALGYEDTADVHNRYRSARRPVDDFAVFS